MDGKEYKEFMRWFTRFKPKGKHLKTMADYQREWKKTDQYKEKFGKN